MKKQLHHAVLIEDNKSSGILYAQKHIEKNFEINFIGNPDVETIKTDRFTIDDARKLKERALQSPFGDRQVFIIACETILREAQNALLKLFEEPPKKTHFIIIVPNKNSLLDTVQSRLLYLKKIKKTKQSAIANVEEFLSGDTTTRLKILAPLIKNKEREKARILLDKLEEKLHKEGVEKNKKTLKEIYFIRQYISDTSSSLKMLLEHLAVTR